MISRIIKVSLRVISRSGRLRALCGVPSVKKQNNVQVASECLLSRHFFFRSMYNKTIIRFGFCDIQNNQGLDLDYSGYHKNLIQ